MIYYGMVNTSKSSHYTLPALKSFIETTPTGPDDRFFLIDNDNDFELPSGFEWVTHIRNPEPYGFAHNVNIIIALAARAGADVVFPNNDVIFTKGWLEPLLATDDAILTPMCNQHHVYSKEGFALEHAMNLEDYLGHEDDFAQLIDLHQSRTDLPQFMETLHLSFFCFRIPAKIYRRIGFFDEGYGRGGGEDVDYRIRAHLAGFGVKVASGSYILHFMGKSTWRGGESDVERELRNKAYYKFFSDKWGPAMAQTFLFSPNWRANLQVPDVANMIDRGDYLSAIRTLLAIRY